MKTIHVTTSSGIEDALQVFKSTKIVSVEPSSRMPLDRFGLLDALNVMDEDLTHVVTFDICAIAVEAFGLPSETCDNPQQVLAAITGPKKDTLLSNAGVKALLAFLEDKKVTKVVFDGRALGDALFSQFNCRISLVIDVRLLPMYCGFQETNPARRHRGVVRLPNFSALVPYCDAPAPTNLHALIAIYTKVKDSLKNSSHTISETAVASGRYLDSVRMLETLTSESMHPYLPLGVVSSPKEGWVKCPCCGRLAPQHFIIPESGICNVCNEVRLPCMNFRRGRADPASDYVQKLIPCPKGQNCVDRLLGYCPYVHEDDDVFLSSAPASQTPINKSKKVTGSEVHQLIAAQFEKTGAPAMPAANKASSSGAAADTNGFVVTSSDDSNGGRGRVRAPTGDNPREWVMPYAFKPFLPPNAVPPCHYHFGPSGCARGASCPFSHEPVPLYVPVPAVHKEGEALSRLSLIPCPHELNGRVCQDPNCPYLHLPAGVAVGKKYAKTHAASDPLKRAASRARDQRGRSATNRGASKARDGSHQRAKTATGGNKKRATSNGIHA